MYKKFISHIVHQILLRMRLKNLLHLIPICMSIRNQFEILNVTNEKLNALNAF